MDRKKLIKDYIEFFVSYNHKEIPNASLIPKEDPTTLFIGSGVETIIPNVLGRPHPLGKKLTNFQKSIRTTDIEEVGDTYHHTFFEMLGNWSLGNYWKEDAIKFSYKFLTEVLKIPHERLAITVFKGDEDAPRDSESLRVWKSLGIKDERIAFLPKKDNFWGPAGKTGPCGPNSEMFYWKSNTRPAPEIYDPKDDTWVEIWNDVFMEFNKDEKGIYTKLKAPTVDTGMGVERTVAVLNGYEDNYSIEAWQPIIKTIEELSGKNYNENKKNMRIIADHIKASVFIIAEGITPSNSEQGYVLRRLIRRTIRIGNELGIREFTPKIAKPVFKIYNDYEHLQNNKDKIIQVLKEEEQKFITTLEKGLNIFNKITKDKKEISGKNAFLLYQSFGFPIEMTIELAKENNIKVNKKGFDDELKNHQELSRTATVGKFKSGLADNSEKTTQLHTATHLLLKSIQIVLKDDSIIQKGSNITPERLRLDFSFSRKLTPEELKEIEDLVNKQINKSLEVKREEMTLDEAKNQGACGTFDQKYSDIVSVYEVKGFTKEICAGPHVQNTSELGHFKIKKESSSSAGVRRIKAILE